MQAGGLAAQSVNVLFQIRLPPSWLHTAVSLRDSAISRRTVMNNAGQATHKLAETVALSSLELDELQTEPPLPR